MRAIIKTSLVAAVLAVAAGCSSMAQEASSDVQTQLDQLKQQKAAADSKIATLESQLQSNGSTSSSSSLLPPNAQSGHCYARVLTPAKYRTEYETVEVKSEGEVVKVLPATYKHDNKKVLVKEASKKIVVVAPAKYKTTTEKVLVRPAYKTWKKGRGPHERIDALTGEIVCLVEVPAQYKTVTKKVMVTPPVTKEITIPAQYKEVHRHVVDRQAQVVKTKIPAQYKKVAKRIKVSDSVLEWREILCETNTTPNIIRRLQTSLKAKGFNPGPIDGVVGHRTMSAVKAYQKSKGLPQGQLTMGTLKSLGVTI